MFLQWEDLTQVPQKSHSEHWYVCLLPWHLWEHRVGFTNEGAAIKLPGLIYPVCGNIFIQINGSLFLRPIYFCHWGHMLSCSPPQIALAFSAHGSHNADTLESSEANIVSQCGTNAGQQKRLAEQIACIRASLIGKVRNLLKYLLLIPLAKIQICKNTKYMGFWCQMSRATSSAFYRQDICPGLC